MQHLGAQLMIYANTSNEVAHQDQFVRLCNCGDGFVKVLVKGRLCACNRCVIGLSGVMRGVVHPFMRIMFSITCE